MVELREYKGPRGDGKIAPLDEAFMVWVDGAPKFMVYRYEDAWMHSGWRDEFPTRDAAVEAGLPSIASVS